MVRSAGALLAAGILAAYLLAGVVVGAGAQDAAASPGGGTIPPFGRLNVAGATFSNMAQLEAMLASDQLPLWSSLRVLKPTLFHSGYVY